MFFFVILPLVVVALTFGFQGWLQTGGPAVFQIASFLGFSVAGFMLSAVWSATCAVMFEEQNVRSS